MNIEITQEESGLVLEALQIAMRSIWKMKEGAYEYGANNVEVSLAEVWDDESYKFLRLVAA